MADWKPWVAYLWECGDEWCDCSQGFIQRHHPACRHIEYEWGVSHRLDQTAAPIWEGRFETDGSSQPLMELEETLAVMRTHWPDAFASIIPLVNVADTEPEEE